MWIKKKPSNNYVEFLKKMYFSGASLSEEQKTVLEEIGIIKKEKNQFLAQSNEKDYISPIIGKTQEDYKNRKGLSKNISSQEWRLPSVTSYEPEFIAWIDSINSGFRNRIYNHRFHLYCEQAYAWQQEKYHEDIDIDEWERQEIERCKENTLYFIERYGWVQEQDPMADIPEFRYEASIPHRVLIYLYDLGVNIMFAKGRQIAASTTFGLCMLKTLTFRTNSYIKFVSQDEDKGQEIFDFKVKYPYTRMPDFMRPDSRNYAAGKISFGYGKKGEKEGANTMLEVAPPTNTVISGGSPTEIIIDEAGNIKNLGKIIENGMPTLFGQDRKTGEIRMKRRLISFGCVCAGTKVWTNSGKLVNIEDLKQEEGILGYNGDGISKEPIVWMKPPAKKNCYRIETTGGDFIECSEDHPFLSSYRENRTRYNVPIVEFKRADELKVGEYLMMSPATNIFGIKHEKHARLLGLMIGDGNYSQNSTPQLSVSDKGIKNYLIKNYNKKGFKTRIYKVNKQKNGENHESIGVSGFMNVVKKYGIYGQSKDKKRLPVDIDKFNKKSLSNFIGGYFDADGNVKICPKTKKPKIVLTSCVKELLVQMKFQLMKFGISCAIFKENRKEGSKKISEGQKNYIFRLYISNEVDVFRFKQNISLLCEEKNRRLNLSCKKIKKQHGEAKKSKFKIRDNGKGKYFLNKDFLIGLKKKRILKIYNIGEKEVYNLNAGITHTYIANGFVTANTGGEMDKGGDAFQTEYMTIMEKWKARDFRLCIVPLFFDWTCRPGITQQYYDIQKDFFYSKIGPEAEKSKIEFHQQYPDTLEDVFMRTANTLVDMGYINNQLKRIKESGAKIKKGFFEPIYGNIEMPEGSDTPYDIIGVNFVPTEDIDPRATVTIFMDPEKGWVNRYYQGTDPIASDSGLSNMASAIWDRHFSTVSAVVDFRSQDTNYVYLQTLLLGLYYSEDGETPVPELVESNVGKAYSLYKISKGKKYEKSLVLNTELPEGLRNQSVIQYGIDTKGARKRILVNRLHEVVTAFGDRIFLPVFYGQLKTFHCEVSKSGNELWGPQDRRYHKDDVLDGTTFSYICNQCFANRICQNKNPESKKTVIISKLVRDKDLRLKRVYVRQKK